MREAVSTGKVNRLHFYFRAAILIAMDNYMRKIKPAKHAEIVRLYDKIGARAVGKKFGVSHQAIINIVRKSGGKVHPVGVNRK